MRHKWLLLFILAIVLHNAVNAQIYIKSEYFAFSKFKNEDGKNVGGKGDFKMIQGGLQIPISIKKNELGQPTAWAVAIQGSYGNLGNRDLSEEQALTRLLNAQLAVIHTRPLNEKWSVMALLGGGIYTDMSEFSGKSFLGQGGVVFIRKINPNLDLGGGAAINNLLGYPMLFPTIYLDWHKDGIFDFNISLTTKIKASAGMKLNDKWKLRLVGEGNSMSAVVNRSGKSQIYVHNWGTVGLQPELRLGKMLIARMSVGVCVKRESCYQDRTIKAFFQEDADKKYPHFSVSPHISFKLGFGF